MGKDVTENYGGIGVLGRAGSKYIVGAYGKNKVTSILFFEGFICGYKLNGMECLNYYDLGNKIKNKEIQTCLVLDYQESKLAIKLDREIRNEEGILGIEPKGFLGSTDVNKPMQQRLINGNMRKKSGANVYSNETANIEVGHWIIPEKQKNLENLFYGIVCKTLNLNGLDTGNIVIFSKMFGSVEIDTIYINDMDVSKAKEVDSMFSNSSINKLDLSNWDVSNVIDTSRMFMDSEINELDLSNWKLSELKYANEMFYNAYIKELKLINFDINNFKEADYDLNAFEDTLIDKIIINKENVGILNELVNCENIVGV